MNVTKTISFDYDALIEIMISVKTDRRETLARINRRRLDGHDVTGEELALSALDRGLAQIVAAVGL